MRAIAQVENVDNVKKEEVNGLGFYKAVNQLWNENPEFRKTFKDDRTLMHRSLVKASLRVRLILMCKKVLKRLEF